MQKQNYFTENVTEKLTLALPILVHSLSVLPNFTQREASDIQSVFFKFLLNEKPDKIKRNLIIQPYENGGLKMPHIQSFESALKMTWIKKLLNPEYSAPWKTLLLPKLEELGGDKFWLLNREGLLKLKTSLVNFGRTSLKHGAFFAV